MILVSRKTKYYADIRGARGGGVKYNTYCVQTASAV